VVEAAEGLVVLVIEGFASMIGELSGLANRWHFIWSRNFVIAVVGFGCYFLVARSDFREWLERQE
jgi:hypothetical protein